MSLRAASQWKDVFFAVGMDYRGIREDGNRVVTTRQRSSRGWMTMYSRPIAMINERGKL